MSYEETSFFQETLSQITNNISNNRNMMQSMCEEFESKESVFMSSFEKSEKENRKLKNIISELNKEKERFEDQIINLKETADLYHTYYLKIYNTLPIQEAKLLNIEREKLGLLPALEEALKNKSILEKENMELLELLRNAEQSQNIAKEALENKETLEKELFLLKELLKESDNCKNSFEKQLSELLEKDSNNEVEIKNLKSKLDNFTENYDLLLKKYNELETTNDNCLLEKHILQEANKDITNEKHLITEEFNKKISDFENKISNMEINLKEARSSLSRKDQEIKNLNNKLVQSINDLNDVKTDYNTIGNHTDNLKLEMEKCLKENESLQIELADSFKIHNEKVSRLETEIDRLNSKLVMTKQQLTRTEQHLSETQSTNTKLQKNINQLRFDLSESRRESAEINLEYENLKTKLGEKVESKKQDDPDDVFDQLKNGSKPAEDDDRFSETSYNLKTPKIQAEIDKILQNNDSDSSDFSVSPPDDNAGRSSFRKPLCKVQKRKWPMKKVFSVNEGASTSGAKRVKKPNNNETERSVNFENFEISSSIPESSPEE